MDSLWFNIRFGTRHFQWGRDGISFKINPQQVHWREVMPHTWKWFAVYKWFGKHVY